MAPADALPQALAHRKQLLKHFFSLLSEPRPWGSYHRQPRDEFYASSPYAGQCPELFMTIDLCHRLAPDDPLVRQYREWVYAGHLDKFSEMAPPPSPPDGVPAWAWYPRLAWLETRRIAGWWVEQRMVPTGEFGGRVGDDSDMYQQYLDLPFFENDGVGAALKDGARMAELADRENLRGGLNKQSTDALHAYEEGINHLALMARWFYGDPDLSGTLHGFGAQPRPLDRPDRRRSASLPRQREHGRARHGETPAPGDRWRFLAVDVARGVAVGRLQPQPGRLGLDAAMGGHLAEVHAARATGPPTSKSSRAGWSAVRQATALIRRLPQSGVRLCLAGAFDRRGKILGAVSRLLPPRPRRRSRRTTSWATCSAAVGSTIWSRRASAL